MFLLHHGENEADAGAARNDPSGKFARARLAGELSNGRWRTGSPVRLSEIGAKFQLDQDSVSKIFAEFQALGVVTLSGNVSAVVRSPCSKEMQEAYEIRAALEEIGGRAATRFLKGNTSELQHELEAMRAAFSNLDLDSFVEHDVTFHRRILQASGNEVLLRMWDSLAVDLRIRGAIGRVSRDFPEVVESHQPIVGALEKGRGREAGLLLRNHVETLSEVLRKSESDSGFHTALTKDLENARVVQKAFFSQENLSISGLACETFYKPAQSIGGDYYDFLP
jgi:DNA-binding GntR family transcriptional regulator